MKATGLLRETDLGETDLGETYLGRTETPRD